MAAKKKPAYQDPSKKNRATTKDKPKSSSPSAAQIAALKGPTSTRKPTEAITAPGQKATGLGKSKVQGNRFSPTFSKNIPTSQKAVNALNWAGKTAAETVALGAAGKLIANPVTKAVAKKVGQNIGGRTAQASYNANMKGLWKATGAGGKVTRTQTPMGPTLRSTAIGTSKQQTARVNNLETAAFKKATRAGAEATSKAMIDVFKKGKQVKKGLGAAGVAASANKNKPKKK
jgi:hypothetical protein